jgi:hypothetical protein
MGICWRLDINQLDGREHIFHIPAANISQPFLDVLDMLNYAEIP